MEGTTIIAVKKDGEVVIAGDGQVTFGNTILKSNAVKIRELGEGKVVAGFAGSVADALTLFERFEGKLKQWGSNVLKAVVELAKEWRTDKVLRRLEAFLLVADKESIYLVSGSGEVLQPDDNVMAIGSGGPYALAAARALLRHTDLSAEEIAREAMKIASEICIYTNDNIIVKKVGK
ncbi:MAG: ATP-dependent protease subunit HslV [Thermotogaceae bacterium]|nr:ATP-dependent protease subunit HslV [Thermotogaceae bacterium]